jgi:hypothetical protein
VADQLTRSCPQGIVEPEPHPEICVLKGRDRQIKASLKPTDETEAVVVALILCDLDCPKSITAYRRQHQVAAVTGYGTSAAKEDDSEP